ncbi:hypothetical protein GCM10011491_46770 [Brucella endophytica]|uniref:Uncharacterized protein n=1 Tax=Brucella endophytica TaxID=1963359 RepID=A0A916SS60_9HYPH|nr:hypothetical protein GCM10011491_46770 [Brucella endophytica]
MEAGEDRPDHLLQPQIRIKPEPRFSMPDVTEWNGKAQFATPRLRSGRIEHSGSQHAEFELADTSLHAQQEPIIGSTWIVDAVMVNDAGFDQAA